MGKPKRSLRRGIDADSVAACLDSSADLQERRLYLLDDINNDVARRFIISLQALDATTGTIWVLLNSMGGDESAGYAIFDAIRMARNHVTMLVLGEASSIAALVLQAADVRLMAPEAEFLIHNGTVPMEVDEDRAARADFVIKQALDSSRGNDKYHRLIARRSGAPLKTVERYCKEERLFFAQEAVDAGFADRVIGIEKKPWKTKENT